MTRPRRPLKSKPQLDAMEQRLVLSRAAAAAPIAEAIAQRPPAEVRLAQQQRLIQAEPLAQVRAQVIQDPAAPQAARAAQREEIRLQREQRREQAREQRSLAAAKPNTNTNPAAVHKVHVAATDTGGFSFSKMWKSIFPW